MRLRELAGEVAFTAVVGGLIVTAATTLYLIAWGLGHLREDPRRKETVS